jgi:hypothetical protein
VVGVVIFLDGFSATDGLIVGSQVDFGVCMREGSRREPFGVVVGFEAILSMKTASLRQRGARNNA